MAMQALCRDRYMYMICTTRLCTILVTFLLIGSFGDSFLVHRATSRTRNLPRPTARPPISRRTTYDSPSHETGIHTSWSQLSLVTPSSSASVIDVDPSVLPSTAVGLNDVKQQQAAETNGLPSSTNTVPALETQGYVILSLLFMVTALSSLDRSTMSIAIIPLSKDLGLDESTKGTIASMFSLGYMIGLVPSGFLSSYSSPKAVLGVGVGLWSIAQMASPIFAGISIPALYACRFLMGVAEACTVPTLQSFIARWVPEEDRSKILSLILSGGQVGVYNPNPLPP
jgi:Na+/melibiose symporter-like transporter